MPSTIYVVSAMVTTLVVLAVVGGVLRSGRWRGYSLGGPDTFWPRLRGAAASPIVWSLLFLTLLLVFGGGTVLFVSGVSVPGAGVAGIGLAAAAVVVFAAGLFIGVYGAARSGGRSAALGVAEGSFLVGLLFVVVIAAKLVV